MKGKIFYTGRGSHRRPARRTPRAPWRPLMVKVLARMRAGQLAAAQIAPRPAKQIARAARHEATRELGGRWHV
jgi:hypothetical protein